MRRRNSSDNNSNDNDNDNEQRVMLPTFRSDEEEGESSSSSSSSDDNNNSGRSGYNSYTTSISPTQSLEEIANANANGNTNTKKTVTAIGNKSDNSDDLESRSNHKRALHEAATSSGRLPMPSSVLRGIDKSRLRRNSSSSSNSINNNSNTNTNSILRNHHSSESSLPDIHDYMVMEDSMKSRTSATADVNMAVIAEAGEGNGGSANDTIPPTTTTTTTTNTTTNKLQTKVLSSGLWRMMRTKNPVLLLLVTGVSMLGVGLYTQSYATLSTTLDQVVTITNNRQTLVRGHFDSIEKDMHTLQRKLLELDISSEDDTNNDDDDENTNNDDDNTNTNNDDKTSGLFDEVVAIKEKIRIESSRISSFEKYIQATSFRDATRKYGNGVLRVKLHLEFLSDRDTTNNSNDGNNGNNGNNNGNNNHIRRDIRSGDGSVAADASSESQHVLVLEMAPLDLMPHSVYTFLEMVDAKLFDGCSFILNAMNIIKAAPLPYEKGSSVAHKVKAFARLGLDTVSFREYSPDYPHDQYTVGFATDGIASFYINTENNTDPFGAVGEPCFARIVSGFETVAKMKDEPVRSGMFFKKRIGIQAARIL